MKKIILSSVLSLSLLTPTVAFGAETYTVSSGDNLTKIAAKFHVSLDEILQSNPAITQPNQIYIGQTLTIPTGTSAVKGTSSQTTSIEQQVVNLVNGERAKVGISPVKLDTELSKVAALKSKDMRDKVYFSHTSPTYGSPFDMMKTYGITYKYAGENIAAGQTSAESVMNSWMNSPGHKANILNKNYTHIGVGYAKGGTYTHYWTQEFIGK